MPTEYHRDMTYFQRKSAQHPGYLHAYKMETSERRKLFDVNGLDGLHAYSRGELRFNRRHGRVGHVFQGRYRAILVEDGEHFLECSRYIHLNPNRSKKMPPAEEYPWSSYQNYVGGAPVVDWVCTQRTLSFFDRPEHYRQFVQAGKGLDLVDPFKRAVGGLVLGSEEFVQSVRSKVLSAERGSPTDLLGLRQLRRTGNVPDVETIRYAVERVMREFSPTRRNRMLIYALHHCTWMKTTEIAKAVGRTPSAVTHAIKKIDEQLSDDLSLQKVLGAWLEEIQKLNSVPPPSGVVTEPPGPRTLPF